MSVHEGELKRISRLPDSDLVDEKGTIIAGQEFNDVYFTGGNISGVDITGAELINPIFAAPVPLGSGGTGSVLTDPGADRIGFWDDSAGIFTWLTAGSGLVITGTTMTVAGVGLGDVTGPMSATDNALTRFDGTTGKVIQSSNAFVDDAGNISASNLSGTNTGDQTITLTGYVTGSGTGSFATTGAANSVSNTILRDSSALSVIGRSANSTGDPADITASTDGHVLRRSGTTLGFGTVPFTSITGTVPVAQGGTNLTTYAAGDIIYASGSGTLAKLSIGTNGQYLGVAGGALAYGTPPAPLFTASYTSADQTITTAGGLTLAHSLGMSPKFIQLYLKCTTAELGYSVNDITPINNHMQTYETGSVWGVSVVPDATNIVTRFGSSGIRVMRKDTGLGNNITNASWRLIVRAWA